MQKPLAAALFASIFGGNIYYGVDHNLVDGNGARPI